MSIGTRIASARKKLGYSQTAFAERVDVSLSSQKRYEKDERDPDTAYLSAISEAGVDIVFILAGKQPPDSSDGKYSQAQCWVCPHCYDDAHHYSDSAGCEREADTTGDRIKIGPTDV